MFSTVTSLLNIKLFSLHNYDLDCAQITKHYPEQDMCKPF